MAPQGSPEIEAFPGYFRGGVLAASIWAAPLAAEYENPYWDEFGEQPVSIEQTSNGTTQTLDFIDFKDGMLMAELDGGVGEISLPVSDSMVRTLRLDLGVKARANELIAGGNLNEALEVMRPKVYPLIKFSAVPESFTQLHTPIQRMLDTLVDADELEEARDIVSRIDLGTVSKAYSESAIRLMNALLMKNQLDAAHTIAASLPVEGEYAVNIRSVMDAADVLRAAGHFDKVIPLYEAIESAVAEDLRDNVRMWLAYSMVLAGRLEEASPIIDELDEPLPEDRLFSLYNLLHGSREHQKGSFREALDTLTRGFVRAQTSYAWVPEMLYLIGDCYARSENPSGARYVWSEIVALYPESPWAEKAENSLAQLP
jgi:tetratricopeptide (TPR) repeat protein